MDDNSWEKFARADPYWAVLTDPRYRTGGASENLSPRERETFFASGETHIRRMASTLQTHFGRRFTGQDCCLDFGSGVGRLLIPMAKLCGRAIGLDISSTMRRICHENALASRVGNIECYAGIEDPSLEETRFDWVNSYIVFQHLETSLGYRIFDELLRRVKPNGVLSVHFTVYKDRRIAHYLTDKYRYFTVDENGVRDVFSSDPLYSADAMMMNDYDIGRLYMMLGQHGFHRVLTEHEDQEGMHGLIFFAVKDG